MSDVGGRKSGRGGGKPGAEAEKEGEKGNPDQKEQNRPVPAAAAETVPLAGAGNGDGGSTHGSVGVGWGRTGCQGDFAETGIGGGGADGRQAVVRRGFVCLQEEDVGPAFRGVGAGGAEGGGKGVEGGKAFVVEIEGLAGGNEEDESPVRNGFGEGGGGKRDADGGLEDEPLRVPGEHEQEEDDIQQGGDFDGADCAAATALESAAYAPEMHLGGGVGNVHVREPDGEGGGFSAIAA